MLRRNGWRCPPSRRENPVAGRVWYGTAPPAVGTLGGSSIGGGLADDSQNRKVLGCVDEEHAAQSGPSVARQPQADRSGPEGRRHGATAVAHARQQRPPQPNNGCEALR